MPWNRQEMARRVRTELRSGEYVNLGIGLPTLVADYLPQDSGLILHSENGILGVGPYPAPDEVDPDMVNAGKETVTLMPGGACFDSSLSFAMIRGGHIDVAVLGGMEVSCTGDLANWAVPGAMLKGIGGAMDLVHGARRVIVLMVHRTRWGESKLVRECQLPVTGRGVVDLLITDLGVMRPTGSSFELRELAPGVTRSEIELATAAPVVEAAPTHRPNKR